MYYFALFCVFSIVSADIPFEPVIPVTGNDNLVVKSEPRLKSINGNIEVETEPRLKLYKNGDSYYYFEIAFKGNYFQATQFCNYHDMNLLSIETLEENKFLFEKLEDLVGYDRYSFWTSGTSLGNHPQWIWLSSGEILNFHNWMPRQPDNAGNNEKCLEIIYEPKKYSNIIWNDNNCAEAMFTICETIPLKSVSNISKHAFQRNVISGVDVV